MRGGFVAEAVGADPPKEEYANASAAMGIVRDDIIHALTGAAASVPEMRRLIQHIPDPEQRDTVRAANIRITKLGLQLVDDLQRGRISPEEANAQVLQILGSPAAPQPAAPAAAPSRTAPAASRRLNFNQATGELE